MNQPRFDAIFFDLGMVLVTFDWNLAMPRFVARGCAPERVRAFLDAPIHEAFERNAISSLEFFRAGQALTGFDGTLDEFKMYWNEIFEAIPPTIALARALAAFYPLFVISNTNPWHMEYVENKFAWLQLFRERIYSPDVHVRKPDARIYEIALARAGVAAERALFLDDRLENIHGAQAVGMNTIHVPTPESAARELSELAHAAALELATVQPHTSS
jgi:putative hydrolase of the HAD superfamily